MENNTEITQPCVNIDITLSFKLKDGCKLMDKYPKETLIAIINQTACQQLSNLFEPNTNVFVQTDLTQGGN